jgi:5-formyltetrahydrofolate cyclo-ligase
VTARPSGPLSWDHIKKWRKEQRNALLERRIDASRESKKTWTAAVERYVREILGRMKPQTIGFYLPFKHEIDARPLVRELLEKGWSAGLPVVIDKKGPLEFRAWRHGILMTPGVYDIPVPAERKIVKPSVLLVPLVGFDGANYRLGYGGGYYDRTIAAMLPRPTTIGMGFELSRLETIYPQTHDLPLDVVVTESGVKRR